ncbi:MAG: hypothetical protein AAB455_02120 [Patescibacteria group bacterium]
MAAQTPIVSPTVTPEEKRQFISFWAQQSQAIEGRLSTRTKYWFGIYTAPGNVGYEMGQLRPGKPGQWDLYGWLTDMEIDCDKGEALLASGLTAAEVATEERRAYYEQHCINPDNAAEVADFERRQKLTPAELDREILDLEELLAGMGS